MMIPDIMLVICLVESKGVYYLRRIIWVYVCTYALFSDSTVKFNEKDMAPHPGSSMLLW